MDRLYNAKGARASGHQKCLHQLEFWEDEWPAREGLEHNPSKWAQHCEGSL